MKTRKIDFTVSEEELKKIEKAVDKVDFDIKSRSRFIRVATLEKADKVLKAKKE